MPASPRRRPGRPRKVPLEDQRVAVLAAARRVFATHGLRAASIDAVARRAGVSRQAVYEQFDDKRHLFDEVLAMVAAELTLVITTPADDTGQDTTEVHAGPVGGGPVDGGPVDGGPAGDVDWLRRHLTPPFVYCAEHPDVLFLLKEGRRVQSRVFLDYRARVARGYAEALGERLVQRGYQPGRLPELVVAIFLTMGDAVLTMDWGESSPPDTDALLELTVRFTAGGLNRLLAAMPRGADPDERPDQRPDERPDQRPGERPE